MKYILSSLLLLGFSTVTSAEIFYSSVHSIAFGTRSKPHLVRFDNGRATFIDNSKSDLLTSLQTSHDKNHFLKIHVDSSNKVYAVQNIGSVNEQEEDESEGSALEVTPFKPAVVKNTNEALRIFKRMRRDYTKSGECYNRAHIWSVEEYQRSGLNTMKIFMFFTEKYIRKYNYHWWFHVTPMVYVGSTNSPRTLDRRYTSGPRQTKTWSDGFIKSKQQCKKVKKFDDFFLNQKTRDCYHIHTSMYYVKPRDIEKRDLTGVEKTEFRESEIQKAYKNAFRQR